MLEYGYPPPKDAAVAGHYAEWVLMRDLLSAGVAIYNEFPEMYQVAANRFFGKFLAVRNWWYPGHAFHQARRIRKPASAPTCTRSGSSTAWLSLRLPSLAQYVPYSWIYMRRPDGQLLRSGDGQSRPPKLRPSSSPATTRTRTSSPTTCATRRRPPQPALRVSLDRPRTEAPPRLRTAALPLHGLSLRLDGGALRLGRDSVIAEMKVNMHHFGNHQHWDAGAFQVWYKGPLAIDSGVYSGRGRLLRQPA